VAAIEAQGGAISDGDVDLGTHTYDLKSLSENLKWSPDASPKAGFRIGTKSTYLCSFCIDFDHYWGRAMWLWPSWGSLSVPVRILPTRSDRWAGSRRPGGQRRTGEL